MTLDQELKALAEECAELIREGDPDLLKRQTLENYFTAVYYKGLRAQPVHIHEQCSLKQVFTAEQAH